MALMGCSRPWLMISRPHRLLQGCPTSSWTLPCSWAPFPAQPAARTAARPRTLPWVSAALLQLNIPPFSAPLVPADPKPSPRVTTVPPPRQLAPGL